MKRLLTNVLLFHKDSEIVKTLLNNIDYFKRTSIVIVEECKQYHNEITLKRNKTNYVSLEETLKIVKDFLRTINSTYPEILDELISKGIVNLYDIDDEESTKKYGKDAYYSRNNGKHTINVPLLHDIEDTVNIVHEFIHYTNCLNGLSVDGLLLTEAISISYEMLLYEYLKQNEIYEEDMCSPVALRLLSIESKSKAILNVINEYERERSKSFKLTTLSENEKEAHKNFHDLSAKIIYLIGETLAIHIYHNYKNGITTINELNDLNTHVNNNEHLESLNFVLKSIPDSEEIRESIIYIREELLKNREKIIKLQK